MEMIQTVFTQPFPPPTRGSRLKVVWVDSSWNLKKGDQVIFNGETGRWIVDIVYTTIAETADIGKKWGLALPKSQRTER